MPLCSVFDVPNYETICIYAELSTIGATSFMSIPFLHCMLAAAALYHLPPRVLPSIQAVEGGSPGLVSYDRNGSSDLGIMQVNTVWLAPFAHITGMTEAAVATRLTDDACFTIAAAAVIMRSELTATGGDLMAAIGRYHSRTPALGIAYQQKVLAKARVMFSSATKN